MIRGYLCRKQLPLSAEEPTARRAVRRLHLPLLSRNTSSKRTLRPRRGLHIQTNDPKKYHTRVVATVSSVEMKNVCLQSQKRSDRLWIKYRAGNDSFRRLHTLLVDQLNAPENLSVCMISEQRGDFFLARKAQQRSYQVFPAASRRIAPLERLCTRQNVSGPQTESYNTFYDIDYGASTHIRTHLIITRPIPAPNRIVQETARVVMIQKLSWEWSAPLFSPVRTTRPQRPMLEIKTLERPIYKRVRRLKPPERIPQPFAFVTIPIRNSPARCIGRSQAGQLPSRQKIPLDILPVHQTHTHCVHTPQLAPAIMLKRGTMLFEKSSFRVHTFGFVASGNTFSVVSDVSLSHSHQIQFRWFVASATYRWYFQSAK